MLNNLKRLLIILLVSCPTLLLAQEQKDTSAKPQQPVVNEIDSDSTAEQGVTKQTAKQRVDSSIEQPPQMDYRDTLLDQLTEQIESLKQNSRQNATAINGLLHGKQIDNETKYKLMKSNLINTSKTYYLLNRKIIDLKSRTSSNNLDVFITSLNNPESKALGFSFSEKVVDLVKEVVLGGKATKNKRNEDIINQTESIIKSPIFNSLVSLSPPLAIGNSIMTFFRTLSVNNKQIDAETLNNFEKEMNKYVSYYIALNEANQKFQNGLNFNKDQLNMLQKNMFDHLTFNSVALQMDPPKGSGDDLGPILNDFFLHFNENVTKDFFSKLEEKYTKNGVLDYEQLLRENLSLKEANNQLEELELQTQRFENLYNEYFSLINSYHNQVNQALALAETNGVADKNKVQQKQAEFGGLKDQAIKDMKASINIKELENNTDNVRFRYKIF